MVITTPHQPPAADQGLPESGLPEGGLPDRGLPDMSRSYDSYFASGLYQARYPRPNRRTLRLLRDVLPEGGRLLDYGAGEGRYCLVLARSQGARVVAADISAVAREHLGRRVRAAGLDGRVEVCAPDDAVYRRQVTGIGGFDVVLLGFGVLGHVAGRDRRLALLASLRSALGPAGRLVLGLPNRARRFRTAQAAAAPLVARGELEAGDIRYARPAEDGAIELYYHLFRRDEILRDLAEAGFTVERLTAESVLPEAAVTRSAPLGLLDDLASGLVPVDWGYGYLVVAGRGG